jgi:hypothetical protein
MLTGIGFAELYLPASRAALYKFPRVALHFLHALTMFSRELSPPRSTSMRWSASVAGIEHQWQNGFSASSICLLRL